VHVVARGNVRRGKSDNLPVPPNLSPLRHAAQGDLVARRDHLGNADLAVRHAQHGSWQQWLLGDGHRVVGVEEYRDLGQIDRASRRPPQQCHALTLGSGRLCRRHREILPERSGAIGASRIEPLSIYA
jgi:hypothetical protein